MFQKQTDKNATGDLESGTRNEGRAEQRSPHAPHDTRAHSPHAQTPNTHTHNHHPPPRTRTPQAGSRHEAKAQPRPGGGKTRRGILFLFRIPTHTAGAMPAATCALYTKGKAPREACLEVREAGRCRYLPHFSNTLIALASTSGGGTTRTPGLSRPKPLKWRRLGPSAGLPLVGTLSNQGAHWVVARVSQTSEIKAHDGLTGL